MVRSSNSILCVGEKDFGSHTAVQKFGRGEEVSHQEVGESGV